MGNGAACTCIGNNSVRVINHSRISIVNYDHNPINVVLDKKENGLNYLQKINFEYCFKNSIGPLFLDKHNDMFIDSKKEKEVQLNNKLKTISEHNKYIISTSNTFSEYQNFYRSEGMEKIKAIPLDELKDQIIYCTSPLFRLPLYLCILTNVPFMNYKTTHKNLIDNQSKIREQVELDLPRTFPNIEIFKDNYFKVIFRSLLYEIAERDFHVAYVQGMNFIAGFCLMLSGGQPEISLILFTRLFSLKSKLFKIPFRECYNTNFPLLFKYVDHFRVLLGKYEKDIYDKVVSININEHLWVSKWILTIFLTSFDNEVVLKFWDILVSKGIDYILFICLTIASFFKKELLAAERLDQFMDVVGNEIKLDKERQKSLLNLLISNIDNKVYIV